ncbi:hypothetical protein Bca101_003081 [Brassica carinata]
MKVQAQHKAQTSPHLDSNYESSPEKNERTRVSPEYTVTTAHRTHRTTERMKKNQRLQHLLLHRFSTSPESFIAYRDLIRLSSHQT